MKTFVKGLDINYQIIGEGRPLPAGRQVFLILHGWGSQSAKWQKVGEMLAGNGLKVIIPDLPGFGESEKPKTAWGLDDYCDFVKEFVDFLNLDKFYLLGHSFGGALAVKYSLKFPEKIEKLFLAAAACFRRKAFKKRFFYIISKIFKIFFFLPGYSKARKGFYKFIVRTNDYLYADGITKDIYLKIIKQDLSEELVKIQIPTVIICGKKDNITPLKQARLINQKIKNSRLEIIPGVDHDLRSEAPEKLTNVILNNVL